MRSNAVLSARRCSVSGRLAKGTLAMTAATRRSQAPTASTSPPLKLEPQMPMRAESTCGRVASQSIA
jgi:hypothetical protein